MATAHMVQQDKSQFSKFSQQSQFKDASGQDVLSSIEPLERKKSQYFPEPRLGRTFSRGPSVPAQVRDLDDHNLPYLPEKVQKPKYDRSKVGQAWVHFGVGNFHRSHEALYADDILNEMGPSEWGIYGMGFFNRSKRMEQVFKSQNSLYTLLERSQDKDHCRVIGAIKNFVYAPGHIKEVVDKLASPECKIVSLTVTEKGYHTNEVTGDLDFDHEQVKYDLEHPEEPHFTYGFLVSGLQKRQQKGLKPFTIMSCDNLQHNGDVVKKAVLQFCEKRDPKLRDWVKSNGAFPNTMVDRIAPSFDENINNIIKNKFGIDDHWPVVAEPYRQWVVEDKFTLGRPQFEKVGVQMVEDVSAYEKMKLSVLNMGHSSIANYGVLVGIDYVHNAMKDARCIAFLDYLVDVEVKVILPDVPSMEPTAYKKSIVQRFQNPAIQDTVIRICMDGSGKIPKFIVQPIHEIINSKKGTPIRGLIFVIATWIKYLTGKNDKGETYDIEDPKGPELQKLAIECGRDPTKFMEQKIMFGDLVKNQYFMTELKGFMTDLYDIGALKTMDKFLKSVDRSIKE